MTLEATKKNIDLGAGRWKPDPAILPSKWNLERLKHVSDVYPSSVDKKSRDEEIEVELCNYTDVYNNEHVDKSLEFLDATATEREIQRFDLRKGDVLLTKDSEDWQDIGVPAIVTEDLPGVLCGYHLFMSRPDTETITSEFLFWALKSRYIAFQMEGAATGVTRYGLATRDVANAWIPHPPRKQQARIANFLNHQTARTDALVEKKQRLLNLLDEKRQAFFTRGITAGLEPTVATKSTEVEWLGKIPEHWDVVRTRFVAHLESGHTPSKSNDEYWTDTDIPWVSLADSDRLRKNDRITETERCTNQKGLNNSSAHLLPAGTVVFTRDATVGLCAILDRPMAVAQHLVGWVCGPEILPEYLLYVLKSMNQELNRLTRGSTISTIGMPDIRSFKTPLPPIEEQREIVEHIQIETEQLWNLIDKVEEEINLLEEKRQALITAAVTGQIDVTDRQPEQEVVV